LRPFPNCPPFFSFDQAKFPAVPSLFFFFLGFPPSFSLTQRILHCLFPSSSPLLGSLPLPLCFSSRPEHTSLRLPSCQILSSSAAFPFLFLAKQRSPSFFCRSVVVGFPPPLFANIDGGFASWLFSVLRHVRSGLGLFAEKYCSSTPRLNLSPSSPFPCCPPP